LAKDAQRLFIETAERGGLNAIGQDPQEQPPRQMGGRAPAQVIAPLQTKSFGVEIGEAGNYVTERCDDVRSRGRVQQALPDAA
jgi:hypothetical protein